MDWLRTDLRHAIRALRRRPAYSALAILTLALGLAVNTVAFSALNALIYKPFRFAGADQIGWLFVGTAADPIADTSLPIFERIAGSARTLEHVAAEGRVPLAYTADGASEEIWSLLVSGDYFSIVTPAPRLGRLLRPGDGESGDLPVVVSERFWTRRLNANRDLGAIALTINQQRAFVAGVMPDEFQGPGGLFEPDLWAPLAARRTLALASRYEDAANDWLSVIARPRADVARQAIESEVLAIARSAGRDEGQPGRQLRVSYERLIDRHPEVRQIARGGLIALALVVLVLFIACFNVAGLVLARSAERRRELSVRAALGASRLRLARQMLTDGLVIALAAGAAALVIARWSATLLGVFSLPAPIPQRLHFVTDWRVFAFAGAAVAIATIVPAVAPLVHLARTDAARWLGAFGTSGAGAFVQRRTRRAFVVVQVAGSTFLLAAALLFARQFLQQSQTNPGFDADHLALMTIDPAHYGYTPDAGAEIAARLVERIRRLPGVRAAGMSDRVSFYMGFPNSRAVSVDGRDCKTGDCPRASWYAVDAGYFDALGIRIVAGGTFATATSRDRDAAVVSETAASILWPGESPLGKSFRVDPERTWLRVIGVAADVKHRGINETPQPYFYRAIDATTAGRVTIIARATGDPAALLLPMRQAAHALDPRLPPQSVQTMGDRMALPLWQPRTTAGFVGTCGLVAVVLSSIGLFGVTYFTVSQRRREFGVRLAIGAGAGAVERQVIGEGLRLAAPGIAIGMAGAMLAGMWIGSVMRLDAGAAAPCLTAAAAQACMTLLATWSPARQAGRANPVEVLRAE